MTTPASAPVLRVNNLSVCLSVSNLERASRWYEESLGFRPLQQVDFPDMGARVAFLGADGVEVELVESSSFEACLRPDPPMEHVTAQGVSQLSIRVDDLALLAQRLRDRDIPIVFGPVDAAPLQLRALFIRDLDGNLIEFVERYAFPQAGEAQRGRIAAVPSDTNER